MTPSTPRKDTGRRVGLTPELIVNAAVELSDGVGLHAWSQRDLAKRLDVAPSVLYHHIGGQEQVIGGVVERLLDGLQAPDPDLPWQEWFRALLYPVRPMLLRFPGSARWLLLHAPAFPAITAMFDAGIAALARDGVARPALAATTIIDTAMMAITLHDDRTGLHGGPRDHGAILDGFVAARDSSSSAGQLIDEVIAPLTASEDDVLEQHYRFLLESLMAGIAARPGG